MLARILFASLLVVGPCAKPAPAPQATLAPAIDAGALESAKADTHAAITGLPAYTADPLSAFEGPEIAAVERDIAVIQNETDNAKFVDEAKTLKRDWDALVGLDNLLQQEIAI